MVSKAEVEQIATELRYKLRAQNIPPSEIDIYLFSEEMKLNSSASISEMIQQLQKSPFFLGPNDSVTFARYLIEPQIERELIYNIALKSDTSTILHTFLHTIGKYNLVLGDDKLRVHN